MKHRLTALLLALALTAGLAGCTGGNTPETAVDPTPDATEATTQTPDSTPVPDPGVTPDATPEDPSIPDKGTPPPEVTHHPDDHGGDDPAHHTPEATHHPDDHQTPAADPSNPPSATPKPTADPTPEPTPEPTPAAAVSASDLYKRWASSSGASLSNMSSVLESFYDLSAGDLEDYVLYMPAMSSSMEEVFIAKAKPGKASAVKAACQSRLADLKEDAELYPATAGNLDTAKLETIGDWVVLAVCSTPGNVVKIVKDAVK